jgi:mono/diheme cytochrome c family protein
MRVCKRTRKYILIVVLSLALVSVGFGIAQAQTGDQDPLEQGAQLFAHNCAVCHGVDGQGRVGASLSKDWPSIRPDLRIRATITNGIPGTAMPAWSQANGGPLTGDEIDALVAYITLWETGGPREILPTPTYAPRPVISPVPNVVGDPNRGAQLYDQNCLVCHGVNGEGRIGATLAKSWASVRADLRVRNTIAGGIEGSAMPAWSQDNGGPLSETEIDDIVAFIATMQPVSTAGIPSSEPEPPLNEFLTGWGGVFLLIVLFLLLVGVAIWVQTRRR